MRHTEFYRIACDIAESEIGKFMPDELNAVLFSPDHSIDFRPGLVVTLLEKVAPRYGCDITYSLPQNDLHELARQTGLLIVRFAQAHARQCQYCTEKMAGLTILIRLMNTYVVNQLLHRVPMEIPDRAYYFFLDTNDPDYISDRVAESKDKTSLRDIVKQWDITGNDTVH